MRVPIGQLHHMERGQAFIDAVLAAGKSDGFSVEIDPVVYEAILDAHPEPWRGLGDVVAAIAKPIAKAVGLGDCESCSERQAWLNDKVPFQ